MGLHHMVNTNVQGVIPLQGRGHVKKPNGSYGSGEYKNLINCEINEHSQVVNRRNVVSAIHAVGDPSFTDYTEILGVIGNYREIAACLTTTELYWISKAGVNQAGLLNSLSLIQPAGGWQRLYGYLFYNQRHYFISLKYDPAAGAGLKYTLNIHYTVNASTVDPWALAYADLTHVAAVQTDDPIEFQNFFVFKDRLFITTSSFVYFSKATDPSVWSVPYGGFIGFESKGLIKQCVALKDTMYVLMDSSIYLVTFSADPNEDLQIRLISDNNGGDSICLYDDVPYFIRDNYMYAISNTSVTRILDLQLDFKSSGQEISRLTSFGDYVIITRESFQCYGVVGDADTSNPAHMFKGHYAPGGTYNSTDSDATRYHVYFINMINGAVHVLDFRDWPSSSYDNRGYLSNFANVTYEDANNDLWLYALSYRHNSFDNTYYWHPYVMNINKTDFSNGEVVLDVVADGSAVSSSAIRSRHNIRIEIDQYVPDGSEYMMKRFRNLLVQGILPSTDFIFEFGYDNKPYTPALDVVQSSYSGRPPYPFRIPLNQRARAMSLRLRIDGYKVPDPTETYLLQLDDIRLFWTYLKRGPINMAQAADLS